MTSPFKTVLKRSEYGWTYDECECPVCDHKTASRNIRAHISKMSKKDEAHMDFYLKNTKIVEKRIWII